MNLLGRSYEPKPDRSGIWAMCFLGGIVLLQIAALATIVGVAYHFISKYW